MRGQEVALRNVEVKPIQYTKKTDVAREALRKEFDGKVRGNFLKSLASDPEKLKQLKEAGLTDDAIERMKIGRNPVGWQVHHKLPIDDGGDNAFSNLVLIKNDPYHLTITNQQNALTKGMTAGETKTFEWTVPNGFVYPAKP